jgi:5'-nucleotidase (lipoprotein e(P4) family)
VSTPDAVPERVTSTDTCAPSVAKKTNPRRVTVGVKALAAAALGVAFSQTSWTAWVDRRAATLVPGAKRFTDRVHDLGGRVVLVSNRKAAGECGPTEDNLAALGVSFDAILCRTDTSDKNPRFASLATGAAGLPALAIVAFVGDNIQDFPALTQDLRNQPESAFAAFADRFFLVPNPMYGSWEKNP